MELSELTAEFFTLNQSQCHFCECVWYWFGGKPSVQRGTSPPIAFQQTFGTENCHGTGFHPCWPAKNSVMRPEKPRGMIRSRTRIKGDSFFADPLGLASYKICPPDFLRLGTLCRDGMTGSCLLPSLQLMLGGMEAAFFLLEPPVDMSVNHVHCVMGNIKCCNFLKRLNFSPLVNIMWILNKILAQQVACINSSSHRDAHHTAGFKGSCFWNGKSYFLYLNTISSFSVSGILVLRPINQRKKNFKSMQSSISCLFFFFFLSKVFSPEGFLVFKNTEILLWLDLLCSLVLSIAIKTSLSFGLKTWMIEKKTWKMSVTNVNNAN